MSVSSGFSAVHKAPWIIAMNATPGKYTTLDYAMLWGIEAMFSDFKSRGFGIRQSQIQKPDRLEKLLLVMAIAMCWAVSCGAVDEQETGKKSKKKKSENSKGPSVPCSNKA